MKKVTIDESIFSQGETKDKSKSGSKKVSKKKKGEDFIDYANKNGIEVNIQYEDKAAKEDKNFLNKNIAKPTVINAQAYKQEKPTGNNNFRGGYKGGYNNRKPQFKKNFRTGNNKFDQCNLHLSRVMPMMSPLYNPYTMQGGYNYAPNMSQGGYYTPNVSTFPLPEVDNSNAESIVNFIEVYLSLDNLNQDLYLRNRMDENGFISASEIANHNRLKTRGVTVEMIYSLFSNNDDPHVEAKLNNDELVLRNRDWGSLQDSLLPREVIQQNKRALKQQAYANPMNMNYVSMQNNYFFNGPPSNDLSAMYMSYQYPIGGMNMMPMSMHGMNPMTMPLTPMNSMGPQVESTEESNN
jgi:hypothetical protein